MPKQRPTTRQAQQASPLAGNGRDRSRSREQNATTQAAGSDDEVTKWLRSLDPEGSLLRYSDRIRKEFAHVSELKHAIVAPDAATPLQRLEPSLFEELGIKMLGHKLLLAKGISAL